MSFFKKFIFGAAMFAASVAGANKRPFDVEHYRLDIRLEQDGSFEAKAKILAKVLRPTDTFELDAYGLTILSAEIEKKACQFRVRSFPSTNTGTLTVTAPRKISAGQKVDLLVHYQGKARQSHEGLFVVANPYEENGPPYFFTHFQPDHAQLFFPNNDVPSDKATSEMQIITDSRYRVLSNGELISDEVFTTNGQTLRRTHWNQNAPHSSYLLALAVGTFDEVNVGGKVPAKIWVPEGKAEQALLARDFTEKALSFQQDFLGVPYPWKKYDQVAVPHFIWGGMENTSLVMMRENGLLLDEPNYFLGQTRITGLISHELAHQWFGDLVTCESWADTWLNEGFASYLSDVTEAFHYENDLVDVSNAVSSFQDYFRHEEGPRSHPLAGRKNAADAFDAVSYQKGAHVLRMLEALLGKSEFRTGLKSYLQTYSFGNATSKDFFNAMIRSSKRPQELRAFEAAWLYKRGYPDLTPAYRYQNGKVTLTINQKPHHPDVKGDFVFPLTVVISRHSEPSYRQVQKVIVNRANFTATFNVPAAPEWINWNEKGTALVRIPSKALTEEEWVLASQHDSDAVWRLSAYGSLLDSYLSSNSTEEALPSSATLNAVREGLTTDPSPYVREALLQRLGQARKNAMPLEWGHAILDLAKLPQGLPDDTLGTLRVRRAALQTLGRFSSPEAQNYLLERIVMPKLDLNDIAGLAIGTARLGTPHALASLRIAIENQERRGYPYFRSAVQGLGAAETPEVLPLMNDVLKRSPNNPELAREILGALAENEPLRRAPETSLWVKDFILDAGNTSDELKARVLRMLDSVKTPEAQSALTAIAAKATSQRLQTNAKETLQKNFSSVRQATKVNGKRTP